MRTEQEARALGPTPTEVLGSPELPVEQKGEVPLSLRCCGSCWLHYCDSTLQPGFCQALLSQRSGRSASSSVAWPRLSLAQPLPACCELCRAPGGSIVGLPLRWQLSPSLTCVPSSHPQELLHYLIGTLLLLIACIVVASRRDSHSSLVAGTVRLYPWGTSGVLTCWLLLILLGGRAGRSALWSCLSLHSAHLCTPSQGT